MKNKEEIKRNNICAYYSHKFGHNQYSGHLEDVEKKARCLFSSISRLRELYGLRCCAVSQELRDYYATYISELDYSIQEEFLQLKEAYDGLRKLP